MHVQTFSNAGVPLDHSRLLVMCLFVVSGVVFIVFVVRCSKSKIMFDDQNIVSLRFKIVEVMGFGKKCAKVFATTFFDTFWLFGKTVMIFFEGVPVAQKIKKIDSETSECVLNHRTIFLT